MTRYLVLAIVVIIIIAAIIYLKVHRGNKAASLNLRSGKPVEKE